MTELEQLKLNTQIEKLNQMKVEIVAYLTKLDVEILDREHWHARARNLELIALIVYLGSILTMHIYRVPFDTIDSLSLWAFFLFILTGIRSSVIHTQLLGAVREQIGVIKALRIMCMIDDSEMGGPRKRSRVKKWSPFAKYKEFWERITEGKTGEQYA